MIKDTRLGGTSLAIMVYLLSYGDGFNISMEKVKRDLRIKRTAWEIAMKELSGAQYIIMKYRGDAKWDIIVNENGDQKQDVIYGG
jgi:hypothetical protein